MKKLTLTLLFSLLASSMALAAPAADDSCEAKAIGKNGKPLAGAAKATFIKKCEQEAGTGAAAAAPAASSEPTAATSSCAAKAISKNGKPLAGAAKTAFIKKCEKDAKAG